MMTPAQRLGCMVGDRFEVVDVEDHTAFSIGSIVELYEDDDTEAPLFKLIEGHCKHNHADGAPGAYLSLRRARRSHMTGHNAGPSLTCNFEGITLRDWFAGQALSGLLAGKPDVDTPPGGYARESYLMADAMLMKAREKQNG